MDILNATIQAVFASLDDVDLEGIFVVKVCIMKSAHPSYGSAMRVALREAHRARDSRDTVGQTRAWKLFLPPSRFVASPTPWRFSSEEPFT